MQNLLFNLLHILCGSDWAQWAAYITSIGQVVINYNYRWSMVTKLLRQMSLWLLSTKQFTEIVFKGQYIHMEWLKIKEYLWILRLQLKAELQMLDAYIIQKCWKYIIVIVWH